MRKWQLLALGLTMVVLLGLLAAGLQTLEFRGGYQHAVPEREQAPGEASVLRFPSALLERLLDVMPWLALGMLVLGVAFFRRRLLREVLRYRTLIVFLVLLALIGLRPWQGQPPIIEEEFTGGEPAESWQPTIPSLEPEGGDTTQDAPPATPWWVTYLIAAALAVPLAWLGWHLIRRMIRPGPKDRSGGDLQEIATQAAAELRAGLAVEEVVLRCWARMADILAARAEGTPPSITPRELAAALARRGVRHDAIAQLTTLFEEVRYGAKADAPRRDRALAALGAIEEAYGSA